MHTSECSCRTRCTYICMNVCMCVHARSADLLVGSFHAHYGVARLARYDSRNCARARARAHIAKQRKMQQVHRQQLAATC